MKPSSSFPVLFSLLLSLFAATFTLSSAKVPYLVDGLKKYHEIKLPNNVTGPESLAFDCKGEGPYAGVSDGRILKWKGNHKGWVEFATTAPHRDRKSCDGSTDPKKWSTCGSPSGLKFDMKTCNLYIADAFFGLLMVGPRGGLAQQLAISTDHDATPFKFLNALDVDEESGVIYFSESSTVYQRWDAIKIFELGDKSGRLLKYDPISKKVEILLQGLGFANGVALHKDGSFVLISETNAGKIHKFWLKGSKAYTSEVFAKFERPPDNIKRNNKGNFWVGLARNRNTSSVQVQKLGEDPVGVKLDSKGNILEILDGRGGPQLQFISEVNEHHGRLWIGSSSNSYAAVIKPCIN